jgi:hypothetical protein
MDLGKAELKAGCSGYRLGTVTITILGSRFNVEPRRVEAGELITVSGSLCKPRSYVTIKLNGRLIGDGHATSRGQFRIQVRNPSDARDSQEVSARCHGKFVGVKIIIIVVIYPAPHSLVSADRTAVPAGQTATLRGTSCPTGNPTASLDGKLINLNVNHRAKGEGFTATATIPASVSPAGTPCGPAATPARPGPPSSRSWKGRSRPRPRWSSAASRPAAWPCGSGCSRASPCWSPASPSPSGAAPDRPRNQARPRTRAGPGLLLGAHAPARR